MIKQLDHKSLYQIGKGLFKTLKRLLIQVEEKNQSRLKKQLDFMEKEKKKLNKFLSSCDSVLLHIPQKQYQQYQESVVCLKIIEQRLKAQKQQNQNELTIQEIHNTLYMLQFLLQKEIHVNMELEELKLDPLIIQLIVQEAINEWMMYSQSKYVTKVKTHVNSILGGRLKEWQDRIQEITKCDSEINLSRIYSKLFEMVIMDEKALENDFHQIFGYLPYYPIFQKELQEFKLEQRKLLMDKRQICWNKLFNEDNLALLNKQIDNQLIKYLNFGDEILIKAIPKNIWSLLITLLLKWSQNELKQFGLEISMLISKLRLFHLDELLNIDEEQTLSQLHTLLDYDTNIKLFVILYQLLGGFSMQQEQIIQFGQSRYILDTLCQKLQSANSDNHNIMTLACLDNKYATYLIEICNSKENQEFISITNPRLTIYQGKEIQTVKNVYKYLTQLHNIKPPTSDVLGQYLKHIEAQQIIYIRQQLELIKQAKLNKTSLPRTFYFQPITFQPSQCITISISGFRSKTDDKYIFGITIGNSQVFALHWETSSTSEIIAYLISLGLSASINVLGFIALLIDQLGSNQFTTVKEEAANVGKYLAYLLMSQQLFPGCQINIIVHSLGSEILYHCLKEIEQQNFPSIIFNDVQIMGGVVDIKKLADLNWKNVAGRVINCYSNNDRVVRYIYKLLFLLEDPCGMNYNTLLGITRVPGNRVTNFDCSDISNGHDYYNHLQEINYLTGFSIKL